VEQTLQCNVSTINKNYDLRKFAISDLHGCRLTFEALINKIGLTPDDELYLLGDYIDRGPDSKGVIDFIWHLQDSGYPVYCLRGNHEQMLLDICNDLPSFYGRGEHHMLASFGVTHAKNIPPKYLEWVDQLDYYFEVDNYLLVHAGFNFKISNPLSDKHAMLWIRNWRADIDRQWLNGRIVVHGHTPITTEAIKRYLQAADTIPDIFIDNGCAFTHDGLGKLCALELTTCTLTFQDFIG
jgi:serine/threonine protein phosphatase 1